MVFEPVQRILLDLIPECIQPPLTEPLFGGTDNPNTITGGTALTIGRNTIAMQRSQKEVGGLTDQNLDAHGRVTQDVLIYRKTKLARAKSYRGRQMIPLLIALFAIGAGLFSFKFGWETVIAFSAAVALMQWHSAGVNRRIDSLIDLLELDSIKNRGKSLE